MKVLVAYFSKTGNTEQLARWIADGAQGEGAQVTVKTVADTTVDDLLEHDAIVIGSPVYYGTMAAEVKRLFDESFKVHRRLDGKVGGAFSASANPAGGNETAIVDILHAMLIHGMIIQGDSTGDHYGPVAVKTPDDWAKSNAQRYGQRTARLLRRLGCERCH